MSALEIVAVLIILAIAIPIILKMRKKDSSCSHCSLKETPISEPTVSEPVKQEPKLESVDQPITDVEFSTEPQTNAAVVCSPEPETLSGVEPSIEPETNETAVVSSPETLSDVEPSTEPQTNEVAPELEPTDRPESKPEPSVKPQPSETALSSPEHKSNFPEDSILKRHYLTHVCALLEALAPERPTDAVLCRHYDAMMLAKIEQCLSDKQAMDRLLDDYLTNKPTATSEAPATQAGESAATAPQADENPISDSTYNIPQDSILRRHYLTHVLTMIEALVPTRPTDAVLCRHYDALIVTKIDRCLNDKQALEQLVYDYENLNV